MTYLGLALMKQLRDRNIQTEKCMNLTKKAKTTQEVILLGENQIEIGEIVYEIQRIYCGQKSAANLIEDQLLKADSQIDPLTNPTIIVYNKDSGAGMSKEVP